MSTIQQYQQQLTNIDPAVSQNASFSIRASRARLHELVVVQRQRSWSPLVPLLVGGGMLLLLLAFYLRPRTLVQSSVPTSAAVEASAVVTEPPFLVVTPVIKVLKAMLSGQELLDAIKAPDGPS